MNSVEDILEHFGVKGMKWGVRKERTSSSSSPGGENKTSKKKRAAQIALVGGVIVASAVVAHKSGVRVSSFTGSSSSKIGQRETTRMLSSVGNLRTSSIATAPILDYGRYRPSAIPMPPIGGFNPPRSSGRSARRVRSQASEAEALRASISTLINAANKDLRIRDDNLNIPFAQRTYLQPWD